MSELITAAAPLPESPTVLGIIERAARANDVDVDKMERLLAMHERIIERNAAAAYAAALARMQPELPSIAERGGIKDRNGNVQSRYALWEDVVSVVTPILSKHGFSLSFRTESNDKTVTVTGVLTHDQGHAEKTSLTLPFDQSGSKNAVQSVGSSTSYGKRYTSAALLNLRTGDIDDDGRSGGAQSVTESQAADLQALAEEVSADKRKFLEYIGAQSFETIAAKDYAKALAALNAKRAKA